MKRIRLLTLVTGAALLAFGNATIARAQQLPINAQLTLQQQVSTYNNGIWSDKTISTRVTSKDLLNLLADAYSTSFPDGAKLVLVGYAYFQVQAIDGSVLLDDVSGVMSYADTPAGSLSETNSLWRGIENDISGFLNETYSYGCTIQFTHPTSTIKFTFQGITQERYSRSILDKYGYRTYQDSMSTTGIGHGTDDQGYFLLLSGKLTSTPVKWASPD